MTRQLLVNDGDLRRFAVSHAFEPALLSVQKKGAFITPVGIHSADDVHQRRLARAVFSAENMNLSALDGQVDVLQRNGISEPFADSARFQNHIL